MSLEKFLGEPVSYLRFSHKYDKLSRSAGTTIRMGIKDENKYIRKAGDIVWMIHSNQKFKAKITKIERKAIRDIDLQVLKDDIAPFTCENHLEFVEGLKKFYTFEFDESKTVYVIHWRRV